MRYNYITKGTCAREISFDLDGNVVKNISFFKGCDGNLKAISILADGLTVEEIVNKCANITCKNSTSSCAAEFARGVLSAYNKSLENK